MSINLYSSYSDEQLLMSLRNNDSQAFGAIYTRNYRDVYRYLLVLVKVPEKAEDLTHEVFLKIWESWERLTIERNLKSYLLRTAHNKAIDLMRKTATETTLLEQLLQHYKETTITESFNEAVQQQYDALVEEALNSLTPQRKKIYEMSKKEKKSYEEIARELNISSNTVKTHIYQIGTLLRNFIHEKIQFYIFLILALKLFVKN